MASSQALLVTLKSILKSNNITYSLIAKKLNYNETSIKRLMTGKTPMTLDKIDQICEIAGIDFFDLLQLTKPSENKESEELTLEQETALANYEDLFLTFYCLVKGLTIEGILQKYRITENRLQSSLHKLEKLELIELHPGNKIKFLISRTVRWREHGPLSKKYEATLRQDFIGGPFSEPHDIQKFLTFPLTPKSKALLSRKLREVLSELHAQSEIDVLLEKGIRSTTTIFLGFRDWTPNLLNRFQK